jgi:ABC-type phosphate transport system substrate-binding protein
MPNLPSRITVVHRSDGSGTTRSIFTTYLSKPEP